MSDVQTWVAVGAACAAATAGWWAAFNGSRTLKQVRNDSRARGRPMVAAELRDHPYARATQILVIRNYGPTVARNVQVTFDPGIPDPENPEESVAPFLQRRYAKPLPALTPGMELDNVWFSGRQATGGWVNSEPMPEQATAHIAYDAPDGSHYEEDFPLDVMVIRNRTTTTASNDPEQIAKEALKTLKGIESAVGALVKQLGR